MPQMPQSQAPAPQSPALQDSATANASAVNQAPVVVTQVASKRAASASSDMSAVVGRNKLCPCGSGKKFKHCHGAKDIAAAQEQSL
jgi:uncharacterized protein YecA (UPF0149 family)